MFDWLKKDQPEPDPLDVQVANLWIAHNRLSFVVKEISEHMLRLAQAAAKLREDMDFLGMQMVGMMEQQNKIQSQLMRNEDFLSEDKTKSTSIH